MDKHIYYRLAGNGSMFIAKMMCYLLLKIAMLTYLPRYPEELKVFHKLSARYFTVWNMVIIMTYQALAFICDFSIVQNEENKVSPAIRKFRHRLFHQMVLPSSFAVFLMFWPIYFFNRELVLPSTADIVMARWQNVLVHAGIVVYVCWELAFLPDVGVRRNLSVVPLIVLHGMYFLLVLYTKYIEPGVWVYEVLGYAKAIGPIWYHLILFSLMIISTVFFYAQWPLRTVLMRVRDECLRQWSSYRRSRRCSALGKSGDLWSPISGSKTLAKAHEQ